MQILITTSENHDFQSLVKKLDAYLAVIDGDDHAFYDQFNKIDALKKTVLLFSMIKMAAACGAIKPLDENRMKVKRMFTLPDYRGKGMEVKVLAIWAKELHYQKNVLETGKKQIEAVALYHKCGDKLIPN